MNIYKCSVAEFDKIAQGKIKLPENIDMLDLSDNELGNKNNKIIIDFLKKIQESVFFINLSGNNLSRKSFEQLKEIIINIPLSVNHIKLNNNDFNKEARQNIIEWRTMYQKKKLPEKSILQEWCHCGDDNDNDNGDSYVSPSVNLHLST